MAEARKTFPMSVFNAFVKGENAEAQKQNVVEMLGFMTKKDIDGEFEPFAAALSRAFIYEQHPELARMKAGEMVNLGDSVSLIELPADVQGQVDAIFAKLAEYRQTVADQAAKIDELEKNLAAATAAAKASDASLAEYKAKADKLEASAKDEGEKVIVASEAKVTELNNKVAELAKEVESMQSSVIAILRAAPVGGEGGAAAPAGAGAPEAGGEPSADFGFGSDPFSDEGW